MTELLDLYYDVLIQILEEVNPEDLSACAQTSRGFNEFIKRNSGLYKAQYLKNFDDPRRKPLDPEPDWVGELQRIVKCRKILESADNFVKRDEFGFVASTVDGLIATASTDEFNHSKNQDLVSQLFSSISQNHDAFMCRSSLYSHAGTEYQKPADDVESRQLSAKLLCLFGIPSTTIGRRVLSTHSYARSRVYDLRKYTDKTRWGPFRDDGSMRTDWEMIEGIMIVLAYNSTLCCRRFLQSFRPPWSEPLEGVVPERASIISNALPMELDVPLRLKDPYNVTGLWSRVICFMDYNDLYNFNFGPQAMKVPSDQSREAITTEEAIRHITMDLQVTSVEPAGQFDNAALPVVYFSGKSRSVDAAWDPNANSRLRGSVRLTPSGDVRWQTISVFYGEERWSSEGIQVGGLRSKRGVIGTWFDKDFDPHGPAGPTAYWKTSDKGLGDNQAEESEDEW